MRKINTTEIWKKAYANMRMQRIVEFIRQEKWFIAFVVLYFIYNLHQAIKIDFESSIFLPFRYEGLLHFKNAVEGDNNAFYFIRDWSTSFMPEEHPLLYFHNLDLVHFFAGFVQYYSANGKVILFLLSSMAIIAAFWMVRESAEGYFIIPFMALILIPADAFRFAPQNLFISLGLLAIAWNATILYKIWNFKTLRLIELFCLFVLAAVVETNLAVLLFMLTVIYFIYFSVDSLKIIPFKKIIQICFCAASPILLLRVIQFISVVYFGYMDEYLADIAYTSKLKVSSDVSASDAIAFYARQGITFFGQGEPQKITTNMINLTKYYMAGYGGMAWVFTMIFCVLILTISKFGFNKAFKNLYFMQFRNILFLPSYMVFFVVSSYLILFLSGNSIMSIYLGRYGINDIDVIYRAFFILLAPAITYVIVGNIVNPKKYIYKVLQACAVVMIFLLFSYFAKDSMLITRQEHFGYKDVLSLIPEKSDIITNHEPSIIAIETKGRANMSWYEGQPYSCDNIKSPHLLKMYKVNGDNKNKNNLYVFLANYQPYSGDTVSLLERHCISPETHMLLYVDDLYMLFKYVPIRKVEDISIR